MHDFERVTRNVVRTFYDPPPTNDSNEPIWLLGQRYDPRPPPSKPTPTDSPSAGTPTPQSERNEDESWIRTSIEETERREAPNGEDPAQYGNWPSAFLDDFESRIWMTYRSGFTAIQRSQDPKATSAMSFRVRMQNLASPGFTSDTGFGVSGGTGDTKRSLMQRSIKRYSPCLPNNPKAPFSIHRFVEHGAAVCGKYPGEWFGPSAAARCIQDLVHKNKEAGLRADKLKEIAMEDDGEWQPALTPSRHEVGASTRLHHGRPSASHYFVATQANNFFYLDPHSTRPLLPYRPPPSSSQRARPERHLPHYEASATSTSSSTTIVPSSNASYSAEELATCHTRRIRRLQIREMDPSMLLAFLITSQEDYDNWKERRPQRAR
ncbi:unnamed protein product [Alternaria alternata]